MNSSYSKTQRFFGFLFLSLGFFVSGVTISGFIPPPGHHLSPIELRALFSFLGIGCALMSISMTIAKKAGASVTLLMACGISYACAGAV